MIRRFLAIAAIACLPVAGLAQDSGGPVILTVTGELSKPNRGALGEDDKFFAYQEDDFKNATRFDAEGLAALDMVKVKADFPKDGPVREFEGPLLADVLAAAGASGKLVTVKALDGYAVEAPLDELVKAGAVIALKRDGVAFAIGDYGPTQIVFPRAERADLKDMPDDRWVWSVYTIRVD